MWLCKKEKYSKKWTSVQDRNNGYSDVRHEKKEKKKKNEKEIAHAL
jgi:hypothetical protein